MLAQNNIIDGYPFHFSGADFVARRSGALWWPVKQMMVVADLHLGRSERYARRGGALIPPWEVTDTLDRLESEIMALNPKIVVSLGDAFDDDIAATQLASDGKERIRQMAQGRDWLWITGNHDRRAPSPDFPGQSAHELPGAITFRHLAAEGPDISGHMHPAKRLAGQNWRCFALGREHLILPAFGTYTGNLDISDPAFAPLVKGGIAICCATRMFTVPIPPARAFG